MTLSVTKQSEMNLGPFITSQAALNDASAVQNFLKDISNLYLSGAASFSDIFARRDVAIESGEALLAFIPYLLAAIFPNELCSIVAS